ncbi:hypothetical protein [Niallia sp. NCCP-28]|nr:hypothetical protein [Niallia sp. NCCP-28]GKU82603.1 hypothetical protein NCCP28_19990 [Niallia sp. NCCP-28]
MNGKKVLYQEKEYILIHKYETGYCELKTLDSFLYKLVHESELVFLE